MVADATASTFSPRVKGADFPMNWLVKASSAQSWPRPGVWEEASTVRVSTVPSAALVRETTTSRSLKPGFVAVRVSAEAPSAAGTSSVFSAAGALMSSLTASTTAVLVRVAEATASTFSPRVKGADFPTNWLVNSSSAQRWPRPGVWVEASTARVPTVPSAALVRVTTTSRLS